MMEGALSVLLMVVVAGAGLGQEEGGLVQGRFRELLEWIGDRGGSGLLEGQVSVQRVPGMGMGLVATSDLMVRCAQPEEPSS